MKKALLILSVFVLSACQPIVTPTVNNFEDCVAAGNPVMESYPRQCQHEGQGFTEEITEIPGDEKPCTREYMPVCGKVQVQCIKAPCPPIDTTFSNRCMAENAKATDIADGACIDESPNPEGSCLSFDGKWLVESNECEGMPKETCEKLGGTYNECGSACRNDPEAEICTMQCIQVCQF